MRDHLAGAVLVFLAAACFVTAANADTIYLKNGRNIVGIIKSKDDEGVKVDIGTGTVGIRTDEIDRIEYSSSEQYWQLRRKYDEDKEARESQKKAQEAAQEKAREAAPEQLLTRPKEVDIIKVGNHIFVEAVLNKEVRAQLLVDTGASIIVLSSEMAGKLGVDMSSVRKKDLIPLQMGDGRQVDARYVRLKSVSVEGVEAKNVDAAILPEGAVKPNFKDGLLGMSFLKRVNFSIDSNNKKLVLEPLK